MRNLTGTTLIETLISLMILSLLLLAIDAAQVGSLRMAKTSYYFTVATQQLKNMLERLKALQGDNYAQQLALWNKQNQIVLPKGKGWIDGTYPNFTLVLVWGDFKSCHTTHIGQRGCIKISVIL